VQTRRLAASFETFTGSVEHTRPEKFPHKATSFLTRFFERNKKLPLGIGVQGLMMWANKPKPTATHKKS